jgi:transcription initiation factor TFIIIB Brf1 subunit/transcription initiation factor TFIIB
VQLLDVGDEMVCPSCGIVGEKQLAEFGRDRALAASDFTPQALGSYLGSADPGSRERFSRGLSGSHSTFAYLKMVSDFAGRNDGTLFECVRMVERVCERLSLPNVVMARAVTIARRMLATRSGKRTTIAAISALAILASARVGGSTTIGTREVVDAHRALGRSLKMSSLIQLSLDSEIRIQPRNPEECVGKILGRLETRLHRRWAESQPTSLTLYLHELRTLALEILDRVPEESKAGHRPSALGATAVYAAEFVMAARRGRPRLLTQKDVAECGDTAEYTVREQYREIVSPAIRQSGLATMFPVQASR